MGSLFKPKMPAMAVADAPPAPKPVRMPTITDPEIEAAAQRDRAGRMRRGGRQSTILTDGVGGSQKLGG